VYDLNPLMTEINVGFSSDCRYLAVCDDFALKFYMLDDFFVSKARRLIDCINVDPLTWQKMSVRFD